MGRAETDAATANGRLFFPMPAAPGLRELEAPVPPLAEARPMDWAETYAGNVRLRHVEPVSHGNPERLRLRRGSVALRPDGAACSLVKRHVAIKLARSTVAKVRTHGEAFILVPRVEDFAALRAELADCGLAARRHVPARVDVRKLRERLKLSRGEFALRFGLDETTLRNWEDGRSEPGQATRTLLLVIGRNPGAVLAVLDPDAAPSDAANVHPANEARSGV